MMALLSLHESNPGHHLQEVIEYCLQTGFDVNGRDNAGYTPLHETCVRGHVNAARLLVTHGADPNANAHDGTRPMHDAVDNNNTEIVRLLLAFGADIKLVTFGGRNIMKLAKTDLVKDLLKGYLADLNGPEEQEQEVPWAFASSCVLDSSGDCGCDVFDNIPPESEEPEPAEGDVEFDFSDKALLPAYNLAILPINGCHNYHRLDDVIEVLGVSRTNFEDSYPDVDILEVSRALFDRQARTRQSKDTGKSGDPNSSNPTEFGSDHVFVIENSDRIREILGVTIEWVHAVRPMVVAPSCQPHHPAAPPTGVIRSHLPPSPAPDLPQAKYADIVSLSSSNIEATSKNTSMGDNEFNTQVSILEHIKSADFNKNKAVSDGDMTKQTTNCGVLPVASVLLASPDSHCPEVLSDVKKVSCTESEGVVGGISILPDVLTTNTREIVPEVSPSVRLPEVTSEKEMPVQTESEEAMVRDAERRSDTQPLPSEAGTTPCDSEYVVRTMVCKQTEVEPIVPCVASGDIKAEPECESLSGPRSEECDTTQGVSQGGSDDGQSVKPEEVESNKDASQSECPSAIQTTTQSTGSNPCPKNVDKEVPENLNQPADEKAAPTDASKCAEEYQHISGGNEQTVNSQENIGPLCSGAERDAQTSTKSDRDSYTGKPTGSGADVTTDMVAVVAPPSGQEHGPNVNTQKTQSDGQREANTCNSVSFAGTDPNKTSVLDSQENPDAQKPDRVLNDPNTVKIDTVKPAETFTETPTTGPTGAHARSAESECENDVLCKCPTSGQPDSNNTDDVVEKTQISSQHQTTSSTVSSNCSVNEIKIASTPEDCGLEACAPGRKRCVSGDRSVSPKAAETMPKAASDIPAACAGAAAPPSSIVSSISSDKEHNNNNNSSLAEDTFDTGLPVLEKHETEGVDDVSNDVHVATPLNDDTNEDREMPQLTIQAY